MAQGKLPSTAPNLAIDAGLYAAINDLYIYLSQQEDTSAVYAKRFDQYDATTGYLGEAVVGASSAVAAWRIQKLVFGVDGDVTITWADGNSQFDNIWDNRAGLTYS